LSLSKDRPCLVIIAGPNGSGKSTLTQWLLDHGTDFGDYINPDDIARTLMGSYEERVREAQAIADERRALFIGARQSFSFETVMSHPSKLEVLREARAAGFFVQMFFVATDDPLINVSRVANRVAKGGHDVPVHKIMERYTRVLALLPEAVRLCDAATLFDNSGMMIKPWMATELHEGRLVCRSPGIAAGPRVPDWMNADVPGWIMDIHRAIHAPAP
jgi:predicted ABC-type ATPase